MSAAANIIPAETDISQRLYLSRETSAFPAAAHCRRFTCYIIIYFSSLKWSWPVFRFRPARTISAAADDHVQDVRLCVFSPAHTHVAHHTSSSSSQSFNTTFSRSFTVVASVAPLVATAKSTRSSANVHIIIK